ncbi:MAG: hypothetical protein AAFX39_01025 [Pseudomonadota bacterium]
MLSRLAAGEIVAFGTPATEVETVRFELHPSVWVGASLVDFPFRGLNWQVRVDDFQFVRLQFHQRGMLDQWRNGMEIDRALEVLFPTDFATYRVAKEQQREAARADPEELEFEPMDHGFLHWDLAETFARGGFELLVLYPPGPNAEYRAVSSVQATSHSLLEIDIVESRIKLPGCDWLPGLVRFVGTLDPAEGASSHAPKGSQSTAADETQVRAYLFEVAAVGPPIMVKEERWADVKKRWRKVSRRAFNRAWAAVVEKYPDWGKAGRRKSKRRAN